MTYLSTYANNTRTQFENWALINCAADGYAADTRGYRRGLAFQSARPKWELRTWSFQITTTSNGVNLAGDLIGHRGDQVELDLHPRLLSAKQRPAVVRLIGNRNLAHMGN